jgi:hypothetical protein
VLSLYKRDLPAGSTSPIAIKILVIYIDPIKHFSCTIIVHDIHLFINIYLRHFIDHVPINQVYIIII